MSLTLIALTGILVGFLCLIIGFFMEDVKDPQATVIAREKKVVRPARKKMVVPRKKAA